MYTDVDLFCNNGFLIAISNISDNESDARDKKSILRKQI